MVRSKLNHSAPKHAALDLNEANVSAIFELCGKFDEKGDSHWNRERLMQNKGNIYYMFGQLALVHDEAAEHDMDEAFMLKYNGETWTKDLEAVKKLVSMASRIHLCFFTNNDEKTFIKFKLNMVKKTYSPNYSAFNEWWESAEAELVHGEIAEMEDRFDDALIFYEKAAKLGNAEGQYLTGSMYEHGIGTDEDLNCAMIWYQKAAAQGHETAKTNWEQCQTQIKAMMGDAEAQYAYANALESISPDEAFEFYLKSAKQGNIEAQYKTGCCYAFGRVIPKNGTEALKWLRSAEKQGHKKAGIISSMMVKKSLFGDKIVDVDAQISKLIDKCQTGDASENEASLLMDNFMNLSQDMKSRFLYAQSMGVKRLG